ncbi:MAG: 3'(2'),5'-bisphosphate nucleotidase CysQ [Jiangellales bacterium]
MPGTESDVELATRLADQAGALLLLTRDNTSLEGRDLADEGDRVAQAFLADELAAARPDDAVLSEEAVDDPSRLQASRVWIIDPLDGTREYSEGRHDWAVHVALWEDGDLTAAAVALPGRGRVLSTADHVDLPERPSGPMQIAVSRSRPPQQAQWLVAEAGAELVPMGSAGYKALAVLLGEADAYVHAGGQYEWDSAAPVAVARAAGLHTSRVDGSALRYNQPDPRLPDLIVARPEAAEAILAVTVR